MVVYLQCLFMSTMSVYVAVQRIHSKSQQKPHIKASNNQKLKCISNEPAWQAKQCRSFQREANSWVSFLGFFFLNVCNSNPMVSIFVFISFCTCTYPNCGKQFPTAQRLEQHQRIHNKKRSTCKHCDASYAYESGLYRHQKSGQCLEKSEGRQSVSSLLQTRITHDGDRFRCIDCGTSFGTFQMTHAYAHNCS